MHMGTHGSQKESLKSLELELQAVVNYLLWIQVSELKPFGGTVYTLNYRVISPVLLSEILK